MSQEPLPPLSADALAFKTGLYKHYKGGTYRALCVARNSEVPNEEFVVYTSLEKSVTWIRPLGMFTERVEADGVAKPRFERIGE